MRIGVFDSGLGGLALTRAVIQRLPQYDYLYLGDTKRVPYGNRSQETIHEFVSEALNFLFNENCALVILACNTASAEALRKSQQEYLPRNYPDRRVLGVIIPTVEEAFKGGVPSKVGVLATQSTCDSGAFAREVSRLGPLTRVVHEPAPLLVPLIENDGLKYIGPVLDDYLAPLIEAGVERIILGCTHYCLVKHEIRARVSVPVISQDELLPAKLDDYLRRHPEIESKLGKSSERRYTVTDTTPSYEGLASRLFGEPINLEKVQI